MYYQQLETFYDEQNAPSRTVHKSRGGGSTVNGQSIQSVRDLAPFTEPLPQSLVHRRRE